MGACGLPVNRVSSPRWLEPLYGEGSTSGYDHVVIGGPGVDKVKPMDYSEKRCLEQWWDADEILPESRLASQVVLHKEMDGMYVFCLIALQKMYHKKKEALDGLNFWFLLFFAVACINKIKRCKKSDIKWYDLVFLGHSFYKKEIVKYQKKIFFFPEKKKKKKKKS